MERNIRERNDEIEELKQFNEILKIRNDSLSSNHLGRKAVRNKTIYNIFFFLHNKAKTAFALSQLMTATIERKTEELEMMKLENSLKQERQNSVKIKNKYDALKVANEVLQRRVASLEKEKKFLEIKLRVKEEEVADFVTYNKPLEKAYKSLQVEILLFYFIYFIFIF